MFIYNAGVRDLVFMSSIFIVDLVYISAVLELYIQISFACPNLHYPITDALHDIFFLLRKCGICQQL